MKKCDPVPRWKEPIAYTEWGNECIPPIENAWLARINFEIHPDQAIALCRLLLPSFIEHEGCVFIEYQFKQKAYESWKENLTDRSQIESMINHVHVYDLFTSDAEITECSFEAFARVLANTWDIALKSSFEDRKFEVVVQNAEQDYGPTVTFSTVSHK